MEKRNKELILVLTYYLFWQCNTPELCLELLAEAAIEVTGGLPQEGSKPASLKMSKLLELPEKKMAEIESGAFNIGGLP